MLLKLALRNIRRSIRDYAIYFITLLFGVAVFYAFNSIGSQQILFDLESSASVRIMDTTTFLMQLFSGVVAVVLGFLIVYANQLLIRRRKHEFGIYLTLGMSPTSISRIVLYETVIVGILSLGVGLVCGILLSQALSFVTAALFETTIAAYHFVFSVDALVMTLICFVLIYVLVSVFNVFVVNRYKLIDLLNADARNEKVTIRNPWICLMGFIISMVLLAIAYQQLMENGLVEFNQQFWLATILMLIGTFLFFWSLAGFVIAVLTHARGIYLRGLVPFTVRQIASKVNTAFVSLWMVCVMLFFSITTFSVGMSMVELFTSGIQAANPYDETLNAHVHASFTTADDVQECLEMQEELAVDHPVSYADGEAFHWDMQAMLESVMPEWGELVADAGQVDVWAVPGVTYGSLWGSASPTSGSPATDEAAAASNILVMSLSQCNRALELAGKEPWDLPDGEMILTNNLSVADAFAEAIVARTESVDVFGHALTIQSDIRAIQYEDSSMESNVLTFVVPDAVVETMRDLGLIPSISHLNINYIDPSYRTDEAFSLALAAAFPPEPGSTYMRDGQDVTRYTFESRGWPVTTAVSKLEMIEQAKGFRMMITYLALYIGFVFLISTAAILAIQQLSVATDSQGRYRLLSKLGCDSRMLNRSLFVQVLVYFLCPLGLAVCHSACAILALRSTLFNALGFDISGSIGMCVAFIVLIYGGYLVVTYLASRTLVRQAVRV